MYHCEFYVLWANNTWTVEGINVNATGDVSMEDTINKGKIQLRQTLKTDPRKLIVVGPVYIIEEK